MVCCDVLEHVDDLGAVMSETSRVLKTGRIDHATFAQGMLFAPSPIELTNYIGCAVGEG